MSTWLVLFQAKLSYLVGRFAADRLEGDSQNINTERIRVDDA